MKIELGDIVIKTLITAGLFKYLRTYLETAVRLPQWDKILKYAWLLMIPIIWSAQMLSLKFVIERFFYLPLFLMVYIVYQSKDFRSARLLAVAVLPFLIFTIFSSFCKLISFDFYNSYNSIFDALTVFTICWLIGFGIYAQKQNKRERLQKQKDEEERKQLQAQKKQLEVQVAERTAELTQQKEVLESALEQLKATQAQLIQSEKLASLGELTAGIAHEIQNPLNFVNNFSELSVDLAKELKEEMDKSPLTPEGGIIISSKDKDYICEILNDLSQNQQKINHHGKRASSIVKGMLEHSRMSTGVKELTDINVLADEYLRLSYHGLRAKDKDFNADFKTEFQDSLSKIEVIPQDLGRVLLNLINNAFYAVNQRKQLASSSQLDASYTPSVFVSTQQVGNQIIIKVKDNGTGMPESVKAKIFQPFFTTKPTGQGTGLGLSLAYDIVTKGHGGTLEVVSTEGVGTEFIVSLPYVL
jgi:two-component system, NtrC family, sensor kinase